MFRPLVLPALLALMLAVSIATLDRDGQSMPGSPGVGAPITFANLTLFPVYPSERTQPAEEHLTLDEALKEKLIEVQELPEAEVNRVRVTSHADRPIHLMAGDIILGGKQDRVVATDTIIPPRAKDVDVEVFCVEHGRWDGSMRFTSGEFASGALRYEALAGKDQGKVWNRVAHEVFAASAYSATGSYRSVARQPAAEGKVDRYLQALLGPLSRDPRAVGVVVAVNGRVTSADLFRDGGLFRKQLPKLLKSYARDAVQESDPTGKPGNPRCAAVADARQLLQEAAAGQERGRTTRAVTLRRERETPASLSFDSAAGPPGHPVASARPRALTDGGIYGGRFYGDRFYGDRVPIHRSIFRKK
jgi:hypothetical protein